MSVEEKLNKSKVLDFMKQVMPNVILDNIADSELSAGHASHEKIAIAIPPVSDVGTGATPQNSTVPVHTQAPAPQPSNVPQAQPLKPQAPLQSNPAGLPIQNKPKDRSKEFDEKINELYKILDGFVSLTDLNTFKNVLMDEFAKKVSELSNEFTEFKKHIVPDRKLFGNEVIYKSNVASVAIKVLESVLGPALMECTAQPDYSILSVSNTKFFEDGTVCNSLVNVDIKIYYKNISVNFSTQITILYGVVYSPLYLERQSKLIPIIQKDILDELRKVAGVIDDPADETIGQTSSIFNLPMQEKVVQKSKYPVLAPQMDAGMPQNKLQDIQFINRKNDRYSE